MPAKERPQILVNAAAWMRERREKLAALCVRETARPWAEADADADVCEAIDFLEFYARGAIALDRGHALFQVPGERNDLRYLPRGVTGVIAPVMAGHLGGVREIGAARPAVYGQGTGPAEVALHVPALPSRFALVRRVMSFPPVSPSSPSASWPKADSSVPRYGA